MKSNDIEMQNYINKSNMQPNHTKTLVLNQVIYGLSLTDVSLFMPSCVMCRFLKYNSTKKRGFWPLDISLMVCYHYFTT